MNQDLMVALHEARSRLQSLKELIHFHMVGEKRFIAEQALDEISEKLNVIYVKCLQCDEDDRRER